MKFRDLNDGVIITPEMLYDEWKSGRVTEPENHQETFDEELLEIILATNGGRNDLEFYDTHPIEIKVWTETMPEKIRELKREGKL